MAKAYMCDRCEQTFGGNPYQSYPYRDLKARVDRIFDLCEDCTRDLYEFSKNVPMGVDLETVSEIKAELKEILEELILPAGFRCTCSNCVHIYVCEQDRMCNHAPDCQQFIPKDKVERYEKTVKVAFVRLNKVIRELESYCRKEKNK